MRRLLALAATAAVITLAAAGSGQAQQQGPWCAGQSIGEDSWVENCTFWSLPQCRNEVIAGNRGVCFQNPWFSQAAAPAYVRKAKRKRYH